MYDGKIARWFVQDPLSEKYYAHSPYNYCVNNPVMFVDPDGSDVRVYIQSKGLGHTFITTGEGILLKGSGKPAAKYLSAVLKEGEFSIYKVPNAEEGQVDNFYTNLYDNGTEPNKKNTKVKLGQKNINEYSLLNINCTTMSIQSVNDAGGNIPENNSILIMPYGIPMSITTNIISPAQLDKALNNSKSVIKEDNAAMFLNNLIQELLKKDEKK